MREVPDDIGNSLLGGRTERSKEQRKRFQFESTASDDEMEDEIDDNLEEINSVTGKLKGLAMTMGEELNRQNGYINVIDDKTGHLDDRIRSNTERVRLLFKFDINIQLTSFLFLCSAQED